MSLYIIGAGGHAKVVLSTLRAIGREPDNFLDDNPSLIGKEILGVTVLGSPNEYSSQDHEAIIAIGSNEARKKLALELSFRWTTAIHPTAWVDPSASIGEGTVVFAGAVVQASSVIGRHVILNTSCSVDHDCLIGDYAHIAPGCHLAGTVQVEEGAFLGIGTVVIPNLRIGEWAIVGAGSAVIRDVEACAKVAGCPAGKI